MDEIKVKTSSPAGDLISFMAGFRQLYKDTGKKVLVYQRLSMPGVSYADAVHPFHNEQGEPVCLPIEMFEMLRPLLLSQEYIKDYVEYNGEEVDFDMDLIRLERYTNQPKGSLNRWPGYVFPQMICDLSEKWIDVPHNTNDRAVLNITQRHRNHVINYFFLKQYEEKLIFAGLQKERDIFCKTWNLDIPLLQVNNFLELAEIIANCKFFLGNASMCFQIAEATKCPRILEIFPLMPNVIPVGERAYDFYHQGAVEFYVSKLMNQ